MARIGTIATAANQGDGAGGRSSARAREACDAIVGDEVIDRHCGCSASRGRPSRGLPLGPFRVARAMRDVARTESPARSSGQRSSFSIWIRTGTRCTTFVNSPETTFRGMSANLAPVDLSIHTTRPRNGSAKASICSSTELPGATP